MKCRTQVPLPGDFLDINMGISGTIMQIRLRRGEIWTKTTTVKLRAVLAHRFTQQLRHQSAVRGF